VDASFSDFDLSRADDYRRFLAAQAAAFLPVEEALDAAGATDLFPDWTDRRRSALLRDDLDALGMTPTAPFPSPSFATNGAIAGGAYVLEGSRLGGAMLARAVAADLPRAFLSAPQPAGHWRTFLARLEQVLATHVERERAVTGAGQVFDLFARAASVPVELQ
jgi:heme oxygenase